jgi:hypothetical protein
MGLSSRLASKAFDPNFDPVNAGTFHDGGSTRAQYAPGRVSGFSYVIRDLVSLAALPNTGSTMTCDVYDSIHRTDFYLRMYLMLLQYPGANGLRFFSMIGDREGTDHAFFLTVESDGAIKGWNKGNGAKTFIRATLPMPLNTWCMLHVGVHFRFSAGDTGKMYLKLVGYDPLVSFIDTPGAAGLNLWDGVANKGYRFFFGPVSACLETDGGHLRIDDFSADASVFPSAGWIQSVVPIGNGSDQAWTQSDWRNTAQVPANRKTVAGSGAVYNTNVSAGLRASVAMQSLSTLGITGKVKAWNIGVWGKIARANGRLLFRRNSVVSLGVVTTGGAGSWMTGGSSMNGANGAGWYVTDEGDPSDSIEVGVQDGDNGAAGTSVFSSVVMYVDHETVDPFATNILQPSGDIKLFKGQYTGNGTVQDVAVPFKFTCLIIKPDAGIGLTWVDAWGQDGAFAIILNNVLGVTHGLSRVSPNGFTVWDATTGVNASGAKCRFLAIADPANRMLSAASYVANPNIVTGFDDVTVPLANPNFAIEALLAFSNNADQNAQGHYLRGPAQVGLGDVATLTYLNQVEAADAIQSIGVGSFQVGKLLASTGQFRLQYLALRTLGAFNAPSALLQIGSYVGDGTASRTLAFQTTLDGAGLVAVFPTTARGREYRWGDQPASDLTSYDWGGGTIHAGSLGSITNFTQNGFTVITTGQTNLNANTERYNYIAFAGGPSTDPAETRLPVSGTVGLLWVEFLNSLNELFVWSKTPLPDPLTYYGGYKDPRVKSWGMFQRALSDRNGVFESADATWTQDDSDGLMRGMLVDHERKYLLGRPVTFRMIADADRRLLKTPLTIMKSVVRSYDPDVERQFTWGVQDIFADKFNSQSDEEQIPQRRITKADFPNADATYVGADSNEITVDAIGKAVPIGYGAITDRQFVPVSGTGPSLPAFDPTIPAPTLVAQIGRSSGNLAGQHGSRRWSYVAAVRGGLIGPLSNHGANVPRPSDLTEQSGVGVNFTKVASADSYYIFVADSPDFDPYGSAGSATKAVYVTHDNVTTDGVVDGADYQAAVDTYVPGGGVTDLLSSASATLEDYGDGQCPFTYVGQTTIGGTAYHTFLLFGHACVETEEIYVENTPQNIQTDVTQAGTGGIWLVPGYAGWTAAFGNSNKYIDINGNRYYIIYGKVGYAGPDKGAGFASTDAPDSIPLAFNVKCIDTNGDGTGTLITDSLLAYRHCLQNWVFGNYRSGPWLPSPVFPDDSALSEIDDAAFDVASTVSHERISGGYVANGIIGANDERITVRELLTRWNLSCDADCSFNRKGQFFVSMEQESTSILNSAASFTEVSDIHETSLKVTYKFEEHFNVQPFQHTQDFFNRDSRGWRLVDEAKDDNSIVRYQNKRKTAPVVSLYFVRGVNRSTDYSGYSQGTSTALDIVGRRLRRTAEPPAYATWKLGLRALNFEVGDIVKVTHRNGIGQNGWVDEAIRVVRFNIIPEEFEIEVTGYDIQVLYDIGFTLGDETVLPGTIGVSGEGWPTATQAQRLYGFLGDEISETFSTGDPIKRLA